MNSNPFDPEAMDEALKRLTIDHLDVLPEFAPFEAYVLLWASIQALTAMGEDDQQGWWGNNLLNAIAKIYQSLDLPPILQNYTHSLLPEGMKDRDLSEHVVSWRVFEGPDEESEP